MISGFGCNIPAIMATRSIESEKDRMTTILVNTLICCGARLPVYVLIAGALFGAAAGSAVFAMYVLGIALATDIRTFHFGATSGLSGEGNDVGSDAEQQGEERIDWKPCICVSNSFRAVQLAFSKLWRENEEIPKRDNFLTFSDDTLFIGELAERVK